jgi:hypothetical protein
MVISNNFNYEREKAGYYWLNSIYFLERKRMQVEWNQCDGLSLARDQRMKQKTVATFFNTREKVVTENNILTHLGKFSKFMKVAHTYVKNQTM